MLKRNHYYNRIFSKRGATSYELANYGLCLGLDGDYDKAEVNLAAAEFYAPGAGIKSLVLFNRGIIAHKRGDVAAARAFFQEALRFSRRKIKKYAKFSILMADIFDKDPDAKKLFDT